MADTENQRKPPYGARNKDSAFRDPMSPFVLFSFFSVLEFVAPYIFGLLGGDYQSVRGKTAGMPFAFVNSAMIGFVVYALSWMLGYYIVLRKSLQTLNYTTTPRFSMGLTLLPFAAICIAYWLFVVSVYDGTGPRSQLVKGTSGKMFLILLMLLLSMLTAAALSVAIRNDWPRLRKAAVMSALSIAAFLSLALIQGRARAFSAVMVSLLAWHYCVARISLGAFLTILTASVCGAIVISWSEVDQSGRTASPAELLFGLDYRRNFDGLWYTAVMLWHLDARQEKHDYGIGILRDSVGDLVGDDPAVAGSRTEFMEDILEIKDFTSGVAPSKVGELYRAAGLSGIALGGFTIGLICKVAYVALARWQVIGAASIGVYFFFLGSGFATPRGYIGGKLMLSMMLMLTFVFISTAMFRVKSAKG